MRPLGLVLAVAVMTVTPRAARGEDANGSPPIGWSYLYDGGAVPFLWGSMAVALGVRVFVDPPETPRLFPASEGGQAREDDTVPEAAVAAYVAGGFGVLVLAPIGEHARAYHLKGYGEAIFTTAALTEVAKATFGRHRPHWTPETTSDDDARRSFFSGHASFTFATSTYLALYLHDHVLSDWREPGESFAWLELLPLGALAAGSAAVAISRLGDSRHHPSDVITGAVVGSSVSAAFYLWQEARWRRSREGPRSQARVTPVIDARGVSLAGWW
jgi:membrane-associated phospholipid phosphatase